MNKHFSYKFIDDDGHTVIVRGKDNIEDLVASGKYSQRLEIVLEYEGIAESGLPDDTMMNELDILEYQLELQLKRGTKSILALSFTGAHRRVWYVYTEDVRSAIFSINVAFEPEVDLQILHEPDENWSFYKHFYLDNSVEG